MVELAMPAGSIQCGLVAFRDGADAIYLGLQSFSARKKAKNFSIEEYSKIYKFAKNNNKKVYITLNTVIYDAQIKSIIKLLKEIELIGCDGLIVQDLGLAKIIRDSFTTLELHGSTQLAVHSVEGVKAMKKLGFTRVVLSRELTINEIAIIRKECRDIELKVFIHGALCYGFSGLCMASRVITGRSANAGVCAQICRSWFSNKGENGFFFSMKDLNAGEMAKQLRDLDIDSLKVEGRMKSPAYVSAVTKYYRAILDNKPYENLIEDVKTTYSRSYSKGWLDDYNKDKSRLIDKEYPSHKGVLCSKVIEIRKIYDDYYALIKLNTDISQHDGLMFLNKKDQVLSDINFSVKTLLDKRKKEVKKVRSGEIAYLLLSKREKDLNVGDSLYLIKKHNQDEKIINVDRFPLYKNYSKASFIINNNSISIVAKFSFIDEVFCKNDINIEKARNKISYNEKILNIFKQSNNSKFEVNEIDIINNSDIETDSIFLPLSEIKKLRRAFYTKIDNLVEEFILKDLSVNNDIKKFNSIELPKRTLLYTNKLPFFQEIPTSIDSLIKLRDDYYLPLPPVFFNENEQIQRLKILIDKIKDCDLVDNFYIGLNNIAHLNWINDNEIKVFADIYFYLANRFSAQSFIERDLNIVGGYLFFETIVGDIKDWPFVPTRIDSDFIPPLFISRTNFSFDSLNDKKKDYEYDINQRDNEYSVISNKELTYLLKKN